MQLLVNGTIVGEWDVPGGAQNYSARAVHYYLSDHLGSTSIVTDSQGVVRQESDYYPYGGERMVTGTDSNHYKFTGKERDTETGLDYFGARYYGSTMGRFSSPDPLMASARVSDPQAWNRYSYGLNNPLRFIDPLGMAACDKTGNCIAVEVNVIYDQNANDGNGLTDEQKKQFYDQLLENAQEEYGDSNIKLDVTYTAGGIDSKGNITGLNSSAINVIVSDHTPTEDSGVSGRTQNGAFVTMIDIKSANGDTLSHELSHHLLGDTSGLANQVVTWLSSKDKFVGSAVGQLLNAMADYRNDALRMGRLKYNPGTGGLQPISDFSRGARNLNELMNTQQAIRPTQK